MLSSFLIIKTVVVAPSAVPKKIAAGMIQCSFEVRCAKNMREIVLRSKRCVATV